MHRFYILTQYYPPETGAPQNRLHSLAVFLKKKNFQVTVFTALPNYPQSKIYKGYRFRFFADDIIDGVPVLRSWIFVSRSRTFISRLLNYFSFVITSFFRLLLKPAPDYLFCESPPLFLGFTAVIICKIKKARLLFNVSDLWPESAIRMNIVRNPLLIKLSFTLERWIYKNAYIISGQTRGIVQDIRNRVSHKPVLWLPNGIDIAAFDNKKTTDSWRGKWVKSEKEIIVLYAGIFGYAQGLDLVFDVADELRSYPLKFVLVGDGPERKSLVRKKKEGKFLNVEVAEAVEKSVIPSIIASCDVFWVPLKKLDLFKGAVPSKIFEPLIMGKPVLLGVEGEANEFFIQQARAGLAYEPENAADMKKKLLWMAEHPEERKEMGNRGKFFVMEYFNREKIYERWLMELLTS